MRKYLVLLMVLCLFVLTSCGNNTSSILVSENNEEISIPDNIGDVIHITSVELNSSINFSNDYSVVGSKGDTEKLAFLKNRFEDIGLQNIHTVEVPMDSWNTEGLILQYECECEKPETIKIYSIGVYPREFNYNDYNTRIVNINNGNEEDYKKAGDIDGVGVLILNSDNLSDKINLAVKNGCSFVMYVDTRDNRVDIGTYKIDLESDYAGLYSKDIPIFVISEMTYASMKNDFVEYEGKEVILNGYSVLKSNINSEFLIGDIEGKKKDEFVYVTASRDSIFNGYLSSSQGISTLLTIADLLNEKEYVPEKTIRFMITTGNIWGSCEGGYGKGIQNYILGTDEKISSVIALDSLVLLKDNIYLNIGMSETLQKNGEDILKTIENDSVICNIVDIDKNYVGEGTIWSINEIPTVMPIELDTSLYYLYENTNRDEPGLGTDNDLAHYAVEFFVKLLKVLA